VKYVGPKIGEVRQKRIFCFLPRVISSANIFKGKEIIWLDWIWEVKTYERDLSTNAKLHWNKRYYLEKQSI